MPRKSRKRKSSRKPSRKERKTKAKHRKSTRRRRASWSQRSIPLGANLRNLPLTAEQIQNQMLAASILAGLGAASAVTQASAALAPAPDAREREELRAAAEKVAAAAAAEAGGGGYGTHGSLFGNRGIGQRPPPTELARQHAMGSAAVVAAVAASFGALHLLSRGCRGRARGGGGGGGTRRRRRSDSHPD